MPTSTISHRVKQKLGILHPDAPCGLRVGPPSFASPGANLLEEHGLDGSGEAGRCLSPLDVRVAFMCESGLSWVFYQHERFSHCEIVAVRDDLRGRGCRAPAMPLPHRNRSIPFNLMRMGAPKLLVCLVSQLHRRFFGASVMPNQERSRGH